MTPIKSSIVECGRRNFQLKIPNSSLQTEPHQPNVEINTGLFYNPLLSISYLTYSFSFWIKCPIRTLIISCLLYCDQGLFRTPKSGTPIQL